MNKQDLLGGEPTPTRFALHPASPNPLTSTAEIAYDLPEASRVRLVVYDALGREVARLVDGDVSAGQHTARFEAVGLPSGVYLYRIEATGAEGTFYKTGRLTLVK